MTTRPEIGERVSVRLFPDHPVLQRSQVGTVEHVRPNDDERAVYVKFDHGRGAWFQIDRIQRTQYVLKDGTR